VTQLGLWHTGEELRDEQAITWNRMYGEFQAAQNLPDEIDEWGNTFKQYVCLRCGQGVYYGTISLDHDFGWCGCPVDLDPAWSKYEPGPGFRSVIDGGEIRSHLTEDEMRDRWDADKLPRCQCGCSFGLHTYGRWCGVCHPADCGGYEAVTASTIH
jgi:hypothetical protein